MRTTPRKRKLRKANDSVTRSHSCEKAQKSTPRQPRRLKEPTQLRLFCACDLHAAAAVTVSCSTP